MKAIRFVDFQSEIKLQGKEYKKAFAQVLSSGNFVLGNEVKKFEEKFAKYLDAKYCIGVANGLEAIQIALMSLGIGKGDEVITTPVSAVATTLAIMAVGAKPVFIDTTEDGLMNPNLINAAISKRTKAILPVHLYGHNSHISQLKNICKKNKLFLIEDACQAHGSAYNGKKLGTFGDLGCFSFYPTKNLACFGDGGAIVTNNDKLANICYQIRDYGQESKYKHKRIGLNSRLDEVHAAILSVKLLSLDKNNSKRVKIAKRYIKNLVHPEIKIVNKDHNTNSNYHLFVIKTKKRNQLKEFLLQNNIQTAIHYPLIIPDQPFYKKKLKNIQMSRQFTNEILSLPCNPYMDLKQVDFVSKKILEFFEQQITFENKISIKLFDNLPKNIDKKVQIYKKQTYQDIGIKYSIKEKREHEEKFCSKEDRFKYILAFQDKEIVGGLTLFKRNASFNGITMLLGGIGGVWVKKEKQRMRIGTTLLEKALSILKENSCNLAYIQIEDQSLVNFYKHHGFKLLGREHTFIGKSGKRYYQNNGMVAPIIPGPLFNKVMRDAKPFNIGKGNW